MGPGSALHRELAAIWDTDLRSEQAEDLVPVVPACKNSVVVVEDTPVCRDSVIVVEDTPVCRDSVIVVEDTPVCRDSVIVVEDTPVCRDSVIGVEGSLWVQSLRGYVLSHRIRLQGSHKV
jgi:ribosomal protein L30/L7E